MQVVWENCWSIWVWFEQVKETLRCVRAAYREPTRRVHTLCSLHQSEDKYRRECWDISCCGTPKLHRSHILPPFGKDRIRKKVKTFAWFPLNCRQLVSQLVIDHLFFIIIIFHRKQYGSQGIIIMLERSYNCIFSVLDFSKHICASTNVFFNNRLTTLASIPPEMWCDMIQSQWFKLNFIPSTITSEMSHMLTFLEVPRDSDDVITIKLTTMAIPVEWIPGCLITQSEDFIHLVLP